jgi:hypothetical protein
MVIGMSLAFIAAAVGAAALACNAYFAKALREARSTRGRASAITLISLLVTPTLAAVVASMILARLDALFMGMPLFYFGYAVGLVCFIVLNRRYRRLTDGA